MALAQVVADAAVPQHPPLRLPRQPVPPLRQLEPQRLVIPPRQHLLQADVADAAGDEVVVVARAHQQLLLHRQHPSRR